MKAYLLEFENKEAKVSECEILNVLFDEEYLSKMNNEDLVVISKDGKKQQVKAGVLSFDKNRVQREAKEYNIKQNVKRNSKKECYWCKKKIYKESQMTIDHIKPKSKCQSWDEAWDEKNMVVSCYKCNQIKDDLNPILNLHIQRKAEYLKYKSPKMPRSSRKVCSSFSSKEENAEYIIKRDSPFYNVKAFFLKDKYTKII